MATFVKVVESESFSETARQLGTTPSMLASWRRIQVCAAHSRQSPRLQPGTL
ncbi:helix-turn-helix domain-containing protein, partial [Klebsiella pneumoniae]